MIGESQVKPIENARRKYLPVRIEWLFIAEAPPTASDRFFYFEQVSSRDSLFIETMRVLYFEAELARAQEIRACKASYLEAFKADGFYLVDACDEPITERKSKRKRIRAALPALKRNLEELRDDDHLTAQTKIILVSSSVYAVCNSSLRDAGLNVVNEEPLDFPAFGKQLKYREKLTRLLNANGRPKQDKRRLYQPGSPA